MPHSHRSKQSLQAAAEETLTPPLALTVTQSIARVNKATGSNRYSCSLPDGTEIVVELPSRFRNTIFVKRGGYVLVDTKDADERANKFDGEISNIVRDERQWRKEAYWPKEFVKVSWYEKSDDEESAVGKMPPSGDSDLET